jgi:hypothetical protein
MRSMGKHMEIRVQVKMQVRLHQAQVHWLNRKVTAIWEINPRKTME